MIILKEVIIILIQKCSVCGTEPDECFDVTRCVFCDKYYCDDCGTWVTHTQYTHDLLVGLGAPKFEHMNVRVCKEHLKMLEADHIKLPQFIPEKYRYTCYYI